MEFIYPEVLAFLLLFPAGLSKGVFTNLLMESLCMSVKNMSYDVCSHVELIPGDVQNIIQPELNRLLNWQVLIETILPAFCVIFLGPWSDSHGRRPLILISVLGQFLYYFILSVQVLFNDLLPASYYLLPSIPIGLSGSYSVLVLAIVCSITDFTTTENRAAKMGTFQASCMVGSLIAQFLTAKVSKGPHGFQITFLICAVACFINLLYAIRFVPESVNLTRVSWIPYFSFSILLYYSILASLLI
ncbi:proton-coupled folate transporter [Nilaparvata lugens]|uniref:proton-coupled folate transporter n=1 Tax=Nilaparvata lugens TaxID=108931 RepID=UPI00193D9085|nr:proton-coupled folate transporter [Nilaparvata lugens]XP_039277071.1 proton-coupled folate transporter [Nilaparvata lugens]XP_039277072.1 proton-coupled folate transporter [Nilaparvata lugens]XP_039277073.1 proton-coupled folate transporter [Nilaparvata lugens]XP_039277074.1 proton-coupled folate transporter [Nilaparvata lugens]XP_039277075.1 proton-coupled folate transporter [Nilaparvata lugens]